MANVVDVHGSCYVTGACACVHVCIRACVHAYVYVRVVHMQTCRFHMEAMNSIL